MKRRNFVATAGVAPLLLPAHVARAQTGPIVLRLASSFPASLDTIYAGALDFKDALEKISDGKVRVDILPTGQPITPFGVFDAVSSGQIDVAHTASYYFTNKNIALVFDTAVPFGLNQRQQNSWLYDAGGLELMRGVLAPFNIIHFPGGNTGCQMGGWFNKVINKNDDFDGLRMRIAGLGGRILNSLGAQTISVPASEIVQAFRDKKIDAAEWVGPHDDEKLGLHKAAKIYYYPAWWEVSANLAFMINKPKWDSLSPHIKACIESAAAHANTLMMAKYDQRNAQAMYRLLSNGQDMRIFPGSHLLAAERRAQLLLREEAAKSAEFKKILDQWLDFRNKINEWHKTAELGMQNYLASRLLR
jgi:TRAP-type mannitol/chloroaromatic compound transport system substrate-binding protein